MQRTTRFMLVAIIALGLLFGLSTPAGAAAGAQWPFVKPTITSKVDGDLISYTVTLQNQSNNTQGYIDVKIKVPDGTTLVDSYMAAPGKYRGSYDGVSVGFSPKSLKAGAVSAPFVVIVKPKADTKQTSFASYAWVRFQTLAKGGANGTTLSDTAVAIR